MTRILIVDDDPAIREALDELLRDEGYEVTLASSAATAAAALDAQRFDFLLLDALGAGVQRPFGDAVALAAKAAPTPVALHTGWRTTRDEARAQGFTQVIEKPSDFIDVLERVAAAVGQRLPPHGRSDVAAVYEYFHRLEQRRWEAFVELCTDDVVYVLPGQTRFSAEVRGKKALLDFTMRVFAQFEDVRFPDIAVYETPEGLAARYLGTWAARAHARSEQTGSVAFRFEGSLISLIRVSTNTDRLERHVAG